MDVQPLLLRLFTVPIEASVEINGKPLGLTKSSGLKLLCKQGDRVTIEKTGFETVTLVFSSPPQQKAITLKLRPIPTPSGKRESALRLGRSSRMG